ELVLKTSSALAAERRTCEPSAASSSARDALSADSAKPRFTAHCARTKGSSGALMLRSAPQVCSEYRRTSRHACQYVSGSGVATQHRAERAGLRETLRSVAAQRRLARGGLRAIFPVAGEVAAYATQLLRVAMLEGGEHFGQRSDHHPGRRVRAVPAAHGAGQERVYRAVVARGVAHLHDAPGISCDGERIHVVNEPALIGEPGPATASAMEP